VTKIGATCHYVIEEVDAGDIISQKAFAKDIPIETAIEIMFREGCYCLLEGLFSVLDLEIPSDLPHSNDSVFWHRLSDI
jgi:methionyl-tRNA formyltransferase